MDTIMSKTNDKVKYIKSLNEKKFRQKYNCFYLEGIKVVDEVLKLRKAIDIMFIAYSDTMLQKNNGGINLLKDVQLLKDIEIINFSEDIFGYMTDTVTSQGILIVVKIKEYNLEEELQNNKNNIIVLDKIQDAGNIGTIIRTCDAFNVQVILCIKGTTDVYSQKVLRSTMGSILRTKIIYIDENELTLLKKIKYTIIGTDLNAKDTLKTLDMSTKNAFILGNEANGVSDNIKTICDKNIKINMSDNAESLNVAIATGIILYEQYNKSID